MVKHVVYVLGAGASREASGPLVRDFMFARDKRGAKIHSHYFYSDKRYDLLSELFGDWIFREPTKANVEHFFQTIVSYEVSGKKFEDSSTGHKYDASLVRRYLVWYISSYVKHCIDSNSSLPDHYSTFARNLSRKGLRPSILTFNYDMVMEEALVAELGGLNYFLSASMCPPLFLKKKGIPLLKLHGSLNWTVCQSCGSFEIRDRPVAHHYVRRRCQACEQGLKEPYIVPPSPDKERYFGPRNQLWRKARELLSRADKIVIIGYSLPYLDIAARGLLRDAIDTCDELEIVNLSEGAIGRVAGLLRVDRMGRREPLKYSPLNMTFRDYVLDMASSK